MELRHPATSRVSVHRLLLLGERFAKVSWVRLDTMQRVGFTPSCEETYEVLFVPLFGRHPSLVDSDEEGEGVFRVFTSMLSAGCGDLLPNTQYSVSVRARCSQTSLFGSWSTKEVFRTLDAPRLSLQHVSDIDVAVLLTMPTLNVQGCTLDSVIAAEPVLSSMHARVELRSAGGPADVPPVAQCETFLPTCSGPFVHMFQGLPPATEHTVALTVWCDELPECGVFTAQIAVRTQDVDCTRIAKERAEAATFFASLDAGVQRSGAETGSDDVQKPQQNRDHPHTQSRGEVAALSASVSPPLSHMGSRPAGLPLSMSARAATPETPSPQHPDPRPKTLGTDALPKAAADSDAYNPVREIHMLSATESSVEVEWVWVTCPVKEQRCRAKVFALAEELTILPYGFVNETQTRSFTTKERERFPPPVPGQDIDDRKRTFEVTFNTAPDVTLFNIPELLCGRLYGVKMCVYDTMDAKWYPWTTPVIMETKKVPQLTVTSLQHNRITLKIGGVQGNPATELRVGIVDRLSNENTVMSTFPPGAPLTIESLAGNMLYSFAARKHVSSTDQSPWSQPLYLGVRFVRVDLFPYGEDGFDVTWLPRDAKSKGSASQFFLVITALSSGQIDVRDLGKALPSSGMYRMTGLAHDRYRIRLLQSSVFLEEPAWLDMRSLFWEDQYASIALVRQFEVLFSHIGEEIAMFYAVQPVANGVALLDLPLPYTLTEQHITPEVERSLIDTLRVVSKPAPATGQESRSQNANVAKDIGHIEAKLQREDTKQQVVLLLQPSDQLACLVTSLMPGKTYTIEIRPQLQTGTRKYFGTWSMTCRFTTASKLRVDADAVGEEFVHLRFRREYPFTLPQQTQDAQHLQRRRAELEADSTAVGVDELLEAERKALEQKRDQASARRGVRRKRRRKAAAKNTTADAPPGEGSVGGDSDVLGGEGPDDDADDADAAEDRADDAQAFAGLPNRFDEGRRRGGNALAASSDDWELYCKERDKSDLRDRTEEVRRQRKEARREELRASAALKRAATIAQRRKEMVALAGERGIRVADAEELVVRLTADEEARLRANVEELSSDTSEDACDPDTNPYFSFVYGHDQPHMVSVRDEVSVRPVVSDVHAGETQTLINSLVSGAKYAIKLRQINALGEWGLWSNHVVIQTLTDIRVLVHEVGENYVLLSCARAEMNFDDNDEEGTAKVVMLKEKRAQQVSAYQVRTTWRSTNRIPPQEVATVEAVRDIAVGSFRDPFLVRELCGDSHYSVCVRVQQAGEFWGHWSELITFQTALPIAVRVCSVLENSIGIKWARPQTGSCVSTQPNTKVTNTGEYQQCFSAQEAKTTVLGWKVYYEGEFYDTLMGNWFARRQYLMLGPATTELTLTGLRPDRIYRITILSQDAVGLQSPESGPVYVPTKPETSFRILAVGETYAVVRVERADRSDATRQLSELAQELLLLRTTYHTSPPPSSQGGGKWWRANAVLAKAKGAAGKLTAKGKGKEKGKEKAEMADVPPEENQAKTLFKEGALVVMEDGEDIDFELRVLQGNPPRRDEGLSAEELRAHTTARVVATQRRNTKVVQLLSPSETYSCTTRALHKWKAACGASRAKGTTEVDAVLSALREERRPQGASGAGNSGASWSDWSSHGTFATLTPLLFEFVHVGEASLLFSVTKMPPASHAGVKTSLQYQLAVNGHSCVEHVELPLREGRGLFHLTGLSVDTRYNIIARNVVPHSDPMFRQLFDEWTFWFAVRTLPSRPAAPVLYEHRPLEADARLHAAGLFWAQATERDALLPARADMRQAHPTTYATPVDRRALRPAMLSLAAAALREEDDDEEKEASGGAQATAEPEDDEEEGEGDGEGGGGGGGHERPSPDPVHDGSRGALLARARLLVGPTVADTACELAAEQASWGTRPFLMPLLRELHAPLLPPSFEGTPLGCLAAAAAAILHTEAAAAVVSGAGGDGEVEEEEEDGREEEEAARGVRGVDAHYSCVDYTQFEGSHRADPWEGPPARRARQGRGGGGEGRGGCSGHVSLCSSEEERVCDGAVEAARKGDKVHGLFHLLRRTAPFVKAIGDGAADDPIAQAAGSRSDLMYDPYRPLDYSNRIRDAYQTSKENSGGGGGGSRGAVVMFREEGDEETVEESTAGLSYLVEAARTAVLLNDDDDDGERGDERQDAWRVVGEVHGVPYARVALPSSCHDAAALSQYAFRIRARRIETDALYGLHARSRTAPTDAVATVAAAASASSKLWSLPSPFVCWRPPPSPGACTRLEVVSVTHCTVFLRWVPPANREQQNQLHYVLLRKRVGVDKRWVREGCTQETAYTLTGLTVRTAYRVAVQSVSTYGVGPPSGSVRLSTVLRVGDVGGATDDDEGGGVGVGVGSGEATLGVDAAVAEPSCVSGDDAVGGRRRFAYPHPRSKDSTPMPFATPHHEHDVLVARMAATRGNRPAQPAEIRCAQDAHLLHLRPAAWQATVTSPRGAVPPAEQEPGDDRLLQQQRRRRRRRRRRHRSPHRRLHAKGSGDSTGECNGQGQKRHSYHPPAETDVLISCLARLKSPEDASDDGSSFCVRPNRRVLWNFGDDSSDSGSASSGRSGEDACEGEGGRPQRRRRRRARRQRLRRRQRRQETATYVCAEQSQAACAVLATSPTTVADNLYTYSLRKTGPQRRRKEIVRARAFASPAAARRSEEKTAVESDDGIAGTGLGFPLAGDVRTAGSPLTGERVLSDLLVLAAPRPHSATPCRLLPSPPIRLALEDVASPTVSSAEVGRAAVHGPRGGSSGGGGGGRASAQPRPLVDCEVKSVSASNPDGAVVLLPTPPVADLHVSACAKRGGVRFKTRVKRRSPSIPASWDSFLDSADPASPVSIFSSLNKK